MSFGFYGKHDEIEHAIRRSVQKKKILVAAASNEGGNKGRSAPASLDDVLCIHACDGKGNDGRISPSPIPGDNFTILGVAIKSMWKKKAVFKTGTSFATPIAAGIAANILDFANYPGNYFSDGQRDRLRDFRGMSSVFRRLAQIRYQGLLQPNRRGGYDYVNLGSLPWKITDGVTTIQDQVGVVPLIKEVLG